MAKLGLKDLSYAICGGWLIVICVGINASSIGKCMCISLEVWKVCLVLRKILIPTFCHRNIDGLGRESVPG